MINLEHVQSVHLLGIGGIGVSAVARLLKAKGIKVSGCDIRESKITRSLASEGVEVVIGHSVEHVKACDLVVYSTAIPDSNPELVALRKMRVPIAHRSLVLQALMGEKRSIGVTGTNGKGTVSAMIAWLLFRAGLDPSFAVGAILLNFGTNAKSGKGKYIVCELDESDGSFTNTSPDRLVINNLAADHLNYYRNLEGLLSKFSEYLSSEQAPRIVHANGDDENVREVIRRARRLEVITHGEGAANTYKMRAWEGRGLSSRFKILGPTGDLGWFELNLPGRYNAMNALAAIAVVLEEGIGVETVREALPEFQGMENRFTIVRAGGITLVKDYISHPVGIRTVLEATRALAERKIVAVFKPYRFTMIHYLQEEYKEAFKDADLTIVTEMYPAGEVPIPGVDTEFLVRKIRSSGANVLYVPEMTDIAYVLREHVTPGDTVVFFGGDDLFAVADDFARALGG